MLYATSRQGSDLAFKTASETQVLYPKLDIADRLSVKSLASRVGEEYGGVDVLINNAGVNVDDGYSGEKVKVTLDTNVRGTLEVRMGFLVFGVEGGLRGGILSGKGGRVVLGRSQWFSRSYPCRKFHGTDLELYSSNLFLTTTLQQMCQIFKPLLSKSGRIVNVSSTGSSLGQYSEDIQQRFRSSKMTLRDLEDLMQEYQVFNDLLNCHTWG